MHRKQLPPNFADNVLEAEFQIEKGNLNPLVVDQLIYLYSQGIEYYEGIEEEVDRYQSFYTRLQNFLSRPDVTEAMKKKNQPRN